MTKAPPKPDPATISSTPGELGRKQQEQAAKRKRGFFSGFQNIKPTKPVGGDNQPLG